jgi:hypothetical protein
MMELPIGKREGLRLEFKRADVLREPGNVAREVVAFLNAEGGDVWIGIEEKEGKAIGISAIEADLAAEHARLQNALADLIEPSPRIGKEVKIEEVNGLLCVRVKQGPEAPYAFLRQSMRGYVVRTGSRVRAMTREELAKAFSSVRIEKGGRSEAFAKLRAGFEQRPAGFSGLRLIVLPPAGGALDINKNNLLPLTSEPRATGNRRLGWNFTSQREHPTRLKDGYRVGAANGFQWLTIREHGLIEFSVQLRRLHKANEQDKRIGAYPLIEFAASVARLARKLYVDCARAPLEDDSQIRFGIDLSGIEEWTLAGGSPQSFAYELEAPHTLVEGGDSFTAWLSLAWHELRETPDYAAFLLMRKVYAAFGFEEDAIPLEYNRETRQLSFPP